MTGWVWGVLVSAAVLCDPARACAGGGPEAGWRGGGFWRRWQEVSVQAVHALKFGAMVLLGTHWVMRVGEGVISGRLEGSS